MRTSVEHRFDKGHPVREYWLAHAEGFHVESAEGRYAGSVVEVVVGADGEHVEALVIEPVRRRGRPLTVDADAVEAAVPARSALVLAAAGAEPPPTPRLVIGARILRKAGRWAIAASIAAARFAWPVVVAVAVRVAVVAWTLTVLAARITARALRGAKGVIVERAAASAAARRSQELPTVGDGRERAPAPSNGRARHLPGRVAGRARARDS